MSNSADKDQLHRPRKLNWREVESIREAYHEHGLSGGMLSDWYGVSTSLIYSIVSNRVWIDSEEES